jgi:hydrogenase maturation factor HypF (carbamoyltransferase family)
MALSYLHHHYGDGLFSLGCPFVRALDRKKADLILSMIGKKINSPLTSSCGRLFDAVAALLGIRNTVSYEGQAAIQLENTINGVVDDSAYPLQFERGFIHTRPLSASVRRSSPLAGCPDPSRLTVRVFLVTLCSPSVPGSV